MIWTSWKPAAVHIVLCLTAVFSHNQSPCHEDIESHWLGKSFVREMSPLLKSTTLTGSEWYILVTLSRVINMHGLQWKKKGEKETSRPVVIMKLLFKRFCRKPAITGNRWTACRLKIIKMVYWWHLFKKCYFFLNCCSTFECPQFPAYVWRKCNWAQKHVRSSPETRWDRWGRRLKFLLKVVTLYITTNWFWRKALVLSLQFWRVDLKQGGFMPKSLSGDSEQ